MGTTISDNSSIMSMTFDVSTSQDDSDSLVEEHNQNLSIAQKALFKWHWKIGHCQFQQVQTLFRPGTNSKPIINGKSPAVTSCSSSLCVSCKIACLTSRIPTMSHVIHDFTQIISIHKNDLRIGQTVSMEQYISSTSGRLQHTK